jgi:hypothetical protein
MNFNKNIIMIHIMVFRSTIPFKDFVTKQILVLKFLRDCSFEGSLDIYVTWTTCKGTYKHIYENKHNQVARTSQVSTP